MEKITASRSKRIDSLTGARFIAIMMIVINHFEFLEQYGKLGEIYLRFFHSATIGVDFFFMLSGFGMMLSSIKREPNAKANSMNVKKLIAFAQSHVSKIYPIYIMMLILGIPYYLMIGYFEYGKKVAAGVLQAAAYLIMDMTLLQSCTGITNLSHSLNGVSWFLSSLFCIYLVSPIAMKWLKLHVKNEKQAIWGLWVSIGCSFILAIILTTIEAHTLFDDLCYGSPYRRVFYVIAGMLIAQLYSFRKNVCLKSLMLKMENICILLTLLYFFLRNSIYETIGSFIYISDMLIVAVDLYLLALGKGFFSGLLKNKYMVYLGNISMYIFITHWLIRMYVDFVIQRMGIGSIAVAWSEIIIILILTFVISVIMERLRTWQNKCK